MAQFTYEYVKPIKEHFLYNSITPNNFSKWSRENMFSYKFLKKPQEPRNMHIPGYGGFIPSIVAENDFGKSYSQLTRKTLSRESLGANPLKLSSTGMNFTRHYFLDPSLTAMSHKFGKQTILENNPCQCILKSKDKITEFQASFQNPFKLIPPTFRKTDKFLQNGKEITKISGFLSNYKQLDGLGWIPDKVLDARRNLTEYRTRYNSEKPIHSNTFLFNVRKLKKTNVPY